MKSNHKESFVSSASQIELLQLSYFIAVAESGSFSKAAEAVYVTQPLLSQHVSNLEKLLEAKLFERNARTIKLTPFGEYFYKKAKEILALTEATLEAVQNAEDEKATSFKLSIGVDPYLDRSIIVNILSDLKSSFPNIQYELFFGVLPDIFHMIRQEECDIGLSFSCDDVLPDDFFCHSFQEDHLELIASPVHQANLPITEFAKQMIHKPLLLPGRESRMLSRSSELCNKLGLQKKTLFFRNMTDIRLAIETDAGYTFIPRRLLGEPAAEQITRYDISHIKESRIIYQAFWGETFLNSPVLSYINHL